MDRNRNASLTIGTTAQIVSEEIQTNNLKRTIITLINSSIGGQIITIAIGDHAANNKGVPLNPGGYWQESIDAGFTPTQSFITAISDVAGGILSIQERITSKGGI